MKTRIAHLFKAAAFVAAMAPVAAIADDCLETVKALYDGGPLDPFVQPPYQYETTVTAQDGTIRYEYVTTFDTPMRSMNGMKGQTMYLAIGNKTWSGPGPDGPWTATPNSLPEDLEAFHKANRDALAANTSEAECLGRVTVEGQEYIAYRYKTQTGPNDDGIFFGARYTTFVDPETNRMMRQEQREFVAHYQPEPGTDVTVQTYTYDPGFALSAPE